jgi:chromate transporter
MFAMLGVAAIYVAFGTTAVVVSIFTGIAPAVLAVVVQAVSRVAKRALIRPGHVLIAVAAFVALAAFAVPFPVVIVAAGAVGWLVGRRPGNNPALADSEQPDEAAPLIADDALHADAPTWGRAAKILGVGLMAWATPLIIVILLTGRSSVLTQQGLFFSGTALVTFGGAYAVLAYVAQRAVEVYGWVTPGEMVRGLGLAETTPGPLIMVVQFVAFLGAYRHAGDFNPWVSATIGALLTTWVTFVPCFVFIFLGAPYIERLRNNRHLSAAMTGITAAVVGVIANLALYFAVHTLFGQADVHSWGPLHILIPDLATVKWIAVGIALCAAIMIYRLKWSVLRTLGVCALLGLLAGLSPLAFS